MVTAMAKIGIIGASGFTGAELLRLAARHPDLEVVFATGDSQAGTEVSSLYPSLAAAYPDTTFATRRLAGDRAVAGRPRRKGRRPRR
jgi:N-acetyl-gamma-glutamylphosphate reductase